MLFDFAPWEKKEASLRRREDEGKCLKGKDVMTEGYKAGVD